VSFLETPRFPEDVSHGMSGGPGWLTRIAAVASGWESRNVEWAAARAEYDIAFGVRTQAQFDLVLAFFRAVRGRAHGFRLKDWADYTCTSANGALLAVTGSPGVYQFGKWYLAGALSEAREIRKPVVGSWAVYRNGSPVTVGASPGSVSVDDTTGRATFVPNATAALSGITQADPGVITSVGHPFNNGDLVGITGVAGMTEINGQTGTVTKITADTFHLGIDTSAYAAYTSGGTASKYGLAADDLYWVGEFDVPVRFDTDKLQAVAMDEGASGALLFSWQSVPLVEIRT